jgi:hypothetical protein
MAGILSLKYFEDIMRKSTLLRKQLILTLIVSLFLSACATPKINKVVEKWGPPAKVEELNGNKIYYWYFYKGRAMVVGRALSFGRYSEGWVTYEFTVDEEGSIIQERKYWKQPDQK